MKNILVTGGCGFIGSVFIRHMLLESDFDGRIINLDKLTYAGNPENLADIAGTLAGRYVFIKADICLRRNPMSIDRSWRRMRSSRPISREPSTCWKSPAKIWINWSSFIM